MLRFQTSALTALWPYTLGDATVIQISPLEHLSPQGARGLPRKRRGGWPTVRAAQEAAAPGLELSSEMLFA